MNILYVTDYDPTSRSFGNEQRTNALWNSLKRHGTVYTLRILRNAEDPEKYIDGNHPICYYAPHLHIDIPYLNGLFRLLRGVTKVPYFPFPYPLCRKIPGLFGGIAFDVVVVRYVENFAKFHLWRIAPALVDIDDHPTQLFDTVTYHRLPYFIRSVAKLLNRILTRYVISKMRGGWISNREQLKICPSKIRFLPNMPKLPSAHYCTMEQNRMYLFTVGLMSYKPNYQGVNNFLLTIWPVFHKYHPDVEYLIGGKDAPQKLVQQWNQIPGVRYVGFVEDLGKVYQHCIATVVPVESGGGTCIKVLESLAYSRVCLSTVFGARGIQAYGTGEVDPHGLFVYTTAKEFIGHFEALRNPDFRMSEESETRHFIQNCCLEDQFEKAVDEQFLRLS